MWAMNTGGGDGARMCGEDAKEWRKKLLALALRYLPVSVCVYLNQGSYCVRDGSGRIVYEVNLEAVLH